ncbi:hypothetical protein GTR50_004046 [Salmonella enterica]|nr:hypothetical protein [Salmonella enterica]
MSDNIKEQKDIVEIEDVKSAAFYFFALLCIFLASLTKFTSSSDSIAIMILRGISYCVLIFLVAGYGARFIEKALLYIKNKEQR